MSKTFKIDCARCHQPIEFEISGIPALYDHIADECEDARKDGYDEGRDDHCNPDYVDMSVVMTINGDRPLWELAAAIRRGDQVEAELHLDSLAEKIGGDASEQVQQGRFGHRAKVAA